MFFIVFFYYQRVQLVENERNKVIVNQNRVLLDLGSLEKRCNKNDGTKGIMTAFNVIS